jgi:hypothetical protein
MYHEPRHPFERIQATWTAHEQAYKDWALNRAKATAEEVISSTQSYKNQSHVLAQVEKNKKFATKLHEVNSVEKDDEVEHATLIHDDNRTITSPVVSQAYPDSVRRLGVVRRMTGAISRAVHRVSNLAFLRRLGVDHVN